MIIKNGHIRIIDKSADSKNQKIEEGLMDKPEKVTVKYKCHFCDSVLTSKDELRKHIEQELKKKPRIRAKRHAKQKLNYTVKCEHCHQGFITERVYRIHMKTVHNVIILD